MDVPGMSTFVQFSNVNNSITQSKSAPATTLQNVIRTEAGNNQWPSKRILRRWYNITERVLEQHHETVKLLATQESRHAWLKPKLRLHLPKDAYDVFLCIFEDRNLVSQPLEALGVIRDVGDSTVQFWSSDACLKTEPMMQIMLREVTLCRDTYQANEIRVAMHYSSPTTVKFTDKLTLQHLRKVVEKRFHTKMHKQMLTHKNKQLVRGVLCEQGVGRGSVIMVSELG